MTAIKPRTARVIIYQGDDLDRLNDLDREVERAREAMERAGKAKDASGPRLMSEVPSDQAARDRHETAKAERDQFAARAEGRGVVVVLHALPRKVWRDLARAHPPRDREEHPEDWPLGPVNIDTFPDALLPMSIDREESTIEGDVTEFLDGLSDYDFSERLFLTAFALNRGSAAADPTLRLGSTPSQTSNETSN